MVFLLDEEIPGGGDITWDKISIDFDALCRDQTFLGAVSGARRLDYVNINLSERALALMRDARTALRTELGTTEHAGGVPAGGVPAGGEPAGGG